MPKRQRVLVSSSQVIELLGKANGKFATVFTKTVPPLKAGNPFGIGNILKVSKVFVQLGCNYASCVNRQLAREDKPKDFVPSPQKWGERVEGLPFVVHTPDGADEKIYLECKVVASISHEYQTPSGAVIDIRLVEPWLRPHVKPEQGTDKEIVWRDYDFANIIGISYNVNSWVVEDNLRLTKDILATKG